MESIFQRTNYFILLAFGAMLIGFAPIFVKLSMLSSSAISFYRMFLALPFLFLLSEGVAGLCLQIEFKRFEPAT